MTLKQKLIEMKKNTNNRLKKFVIDDILNYYNDDDEITGYIRDVLNYGCQSGIVNSLIYYIDTHKFAKEYIDEIMEILDDIKENTGQEFDNYQGDRLNTLAWLGYEETMRKIAEELNIEY